MCASSRPRPDPATPVEPGSRPGYHGVSDQGIGELGEASSGDGITGNSDDGHGGVFQSKKSGQLWLIPKDIGPLNSNFATTPMAVNVQDRGPELPARAHGGELFASERNGVCTLWFCVNDGPPAKWAQVLLGPQFDGRG